MHLIYRSFQDFAGENSSKPRYFGGTRDFSKSPQVFRGSGSRRVARRRSRSAEAPFDSRVRLGGLVLSTDLTANGGAKRFWRGCNFTSPSSFPLVNTQKKKKAAVKSSIFGRNDRVKILWNPVRTRAGYCERFGESIVLYIFRFNPVSFSFL